MRSSKVKCKICQHDMDIFDKAYVLGKYQVQYYRCPYCGFICTEEPYWLEEAYGSAITNSDIGLVGRNIMLARRVIAVLAGCFPETQSYLDYGGGYGMFVRIMRDAGYDFEWYDRYAENLFAKGHEAVHEHYDVATAFELAEHLPDPFTDFDQILAWADNCIFTTELISETNPPRVADWWYYGPEHGQHVAFYTRHAIEILAEHYDYHLATWGGTHVLSKKKVPQWRLKLCLRLPRVISRLRRRTSLLPADYEQITGRPLT